MKLRNFRTFLAFFATLCFVTYFTLWNYSEHKLPGYVFHVKLPLLIKPGESQEEYYWRTQKSLFPQIEIPNPIPKGMPNDDTFFIVSMEKEGEIKINSIKFAEISSTKPLTNKLKEFFEARQNEGVYEPDSEKIVRAVAVKVPPSTKYGEFIKIVDAVKESGADPIVLQIDELPK